MLTLWRPKQDLFRWNSQLDTLFDWAPAPEASGPAVDVTEEETRYVLRADLPGFEEKDIQVCVVDDVLVFSGKREKSAEEKQGTVTQAERRHGSFCRRFALDSSVDESSIEASYKSGVLTVALPKKEAAKPRQIPVHTS
jgi:HSP20 family protein